LITLDRREKWSTAADTRRLGNLHLRDQIAEKMQAAERASILLAAAPERWGDSGEG
jgi:hypothetical protein